MPLDYEKIYADRFLANARHIDDAIKAKTTSASQQVKIAKWASKNQYPLEVVLRELRRRSLTAEMLRRTFAKEPNRQGFHEGLAAGYIGNMTRLVDGFCDLSGTGGAALFLGADGRVSLGSGPDQGSGARVKSIDFTWVSGPYRVFAFHKYTKDDGGHQNNQEDEAKRFLDAAAASGGRIASVMAESSAVQVADDGTVPTVFIAICDGPYYTKDRLSGLARVDALADRVAAHPHVHATSINHLGQVLRRLHDPRNPAPAAW